MAAKLVTYVPPPQPTLGGDQLYLQQQLAAISNAIAASNAAIKADEAAITANAAAITGHEAAWTPYTPTVSITSGAGTATGRYKQIGKTVHIQLHLTVTTGGSIASIGLPPGMSAQAAYPGSCFLIGREDAATGSLWTGLVGYPTLTVVSPFRYDGSAALTTGWRIDLSGTIEIA